MHFPTTLRYNWRKKRFSTQWQAENCNEWRIWMHGFLYQTCSATTGVKQWSVDKLLILGHPSKHTCSILYRCASADQLSIFSSAFRLHATHFIGRKTKNKNIWFFFFKFDAIRYGNRRSLDQDTNIFFGGKRRFLIYSEQCWPPTFLPTLPTVYIIPFEWCPISMTMRNYFR